MAWYYPFLYQNKSLKKYASLFIEATLQRCYFLHFAGSWPESDFWKTKNILNNKDKINFLKSFQKYLNTNVTGQPVGMKQIKK